MNALSLEMALVQMRCGLELLHILQQTIAEDDRPEAQLSEALYGIYDYLSQSADQMEDIMNQLRKEKSHE